jgi:hypothetical protein
MWKLPDSGMILSEKPSFRRSFPPGNHTVILNVSDPAGLWSRTTVNFSVMEPNRSPIVVIAEPKSWDQFYEDEFVPLSSNGSFDPDGDSINFTWVSSLDGVISVNGTDSVLLSIGLHQIFLWVDDGLFNVSHYVQIRVLERELPPNLPPVAVISSPGNLEAFHVNEMIQFVSGSFDPEGSNLTFAWYLNDVRISNESTFSTILTSGTHEVTLVVEDGIHSNLTSIILIVTDRPPLVEITVNGTLLTVNEVTVLVNDSISFDASGSSDPDGTDLTFVWMVDGIIAGNNPSFDTTFSPGIHMVSLNATDSTGRTVTKLVRVICLERQIDPDDDDTDDDDTGSKSRSRDYILIAAGALLLIILIGGVIFTLIRKSEPSYHEE